jgi:hypothetical protein
LSLPCLDPQRCGSAARAATPLGTKSRVPTVGGQLVTSLLVATALHHALHAPDAPCIMCLSLDIPSVVTADQLISPW